MRRLFRLLVPGRHAMGWTAAASVLALLAVLAGILLLALSGWLITASALAGAGAILALDIFAPGAGIRASAVGRTVARYLERLVGHEATFRQLAELRVGAFDRLLSLPVATLESMRRGDALNRLTRDIDLLDHFIPRLLLPTVAAVVATMIVVAWLGALEPQLGWVALGAFAGGGSAVICVGVAAVRSPGRRLADANPRMRSGLADWLRALAELISVGRAGAHGESVMAEAERQLQAQRAQRRIEALMQGALAAFGYTGFWLVLLLALGLHAEGALSAPLAGAAALVTLGLVDALAPLAGGWCFFETCRRTALRVEGVSEPHGTASRGGRLRAAETGLRLRDVSFCYPGQGDPVVSNIGLRVDVGERVLIRGASGIGKSTLGRLMAGVLEPTSGTVALGGHPVGRLGNADLRATVGYLQQQPVLFRDTLRDNLAPARPDTDEERLRQALAAVGLTGFAEGLPEGLDSWIGEQGSTVSGGEARRLALARMLIADFPVMILDEPLAGVDAETAAAVGQNLERALRGKTVVVLSHDPGLLRFDRCLELVPGRGGARLGPGKSG